MTYCRFGGISRAKGGLIYVDFTIFVMQSSPDNPDTVKDSYDSTFTDYRNLSSEVGVFGNLFSGYEKHK